MNYIKLISFFFLSIDIVIAQSLYSNFRIYPSTVTQTEVFVTKHPTDPNLLFSSAITINLSNGFVSEGIYISSDGGITWSGSDTCKGSPISFHRGDPGIAIDKNGTFILTRLGFQDGLFAHYSTDNGSTWSSQRTIAGERQDRASLITDNIPTSPFYGRTYTSYVELLPPFPVLVSYTNNGGSSWSAVDTIHYTSQRSQGAELSIGPTGEVYSVWANVISSSPYTEDKVGVAISTNGGVSWTVKNNAIDINGIQGSLPTKGSIRVNGLPKFDVDRTNGTRRGWIYIVTTQKNLLPAGNDPDIVFYRSSDGGSTWSNGIRVNQDGLNNGKIQYFPAIHVDENGGINVLYYDDRNTTTDSTGVFISRSTDGGDTWNDFEISDHNFRPQPASGLLGQGYQGDNIALTSVGQTLIPLWMDNYSGLYQIWSTRVPISTLVSVKNENILPNIFLLEQNYPNPFNPSTTITFQLPKDDFVTLKVFDVLGKEVITLLEEEKSAGKNHVEFTADHRFSSGVYFYKITAGEYISAKKMTLLK